MITVALVNQKGGIGKTTATVNLGVALALAGKRVLMVDADPQASLTDYFFVAAEQDYSLYDALLKKVYVEPLKVRENLFLLPANIELASGERELTNEMNRERKLATLLKKSYVNYDYILIDCSPSLNNLTINALAAADYALIPVLTEVMAVKSVHLIMGSIREVQESGLNPELKVWKLLATMFVSNQKHHVAALELLQNAYPEDLYPEPVPETTRYKNASASQKAVGEMFPVMAAYWDDMAQALIRDAEGPK